MKLTKLAIEHAELPPAGTKQRFLRDDLARGLGVRITRDGARSFIFEYWSRGRSHRLTIGRWPDLNIPQARDKAAEFRAAIARGEDPASDLSESRHEATFATLVERFLNDYARPHKKPNSIRDDKYCLSLIPHNWNNRRLSEITRDAISRLHVMIGEKHGRYAANHVVRLLRSMLNRAIEWRMLTGPNPAQRLRMFKEERRQRFLNPEELQRVNRALLEEPDWRWRAFFPLSVMLGTRKGELLTARWENIDLIAGTWRIPETKAGNSHLLPLPASAITMLEALPSRGQSEWVFPSTESASGHVVNPAKPWRRIRNRAGIPDVRIHDLRHSLASLLLAQGYGLPLIGKVLNHSTPAVTARYAHLDIDPLREALDRTAALVMTNGSNPTPDK